MDPQTRSRADAALRRRRHRQRRPRHGRRRRRARLRAHGRARPRRPSSAARREREYARWLIWELGQAVGVRPASIHELYIARGRGEVQRLHRAGDQRARRRPTTPRARSSAPRSRMDAGAFILEIARSEIAYTEQRPTEYVAVMLAAALREGFRGPVFIQGDHFQVNHKKYAADPMPEVNAVKQLVREAVAAGFYNIDVDTSTLVDLSKADARRAAAPELRECVELTRYVRVARARGRDHLHRRRDRRGRDRELARSRSCARSWTGFNAGARRRSRPVARACPRSPCRAARRTAAWCSPTARSPTSKLDLDTLETLGEIARDEYGLSGAVQHGASTLPDTAFNNFPKTRDGRDPSRDELPEHDVRPPARPTLRREIYAWLAENAKDERKATDTDEQFFYKTRKKAIGPFKRQLWDLPRTSKAKLAAAYDAKFSSCSRSSRSAARASRRAVRDARRSSIARCRPTAAPAVAAAPDDADLQRLSGPRSGASVDRAPTRRRRRPGGRRARPALAVRARRLTARCAHEVKDALNGAVGEPRGRAPARASRDRRRRGCRRSPRRRPVSWSAPLSSWGRSVSLARAPRDGAPADVADALGQRPRAAGACAPVTGR